jgi:hypothetical protein
MIRIKVMKLNGGGNYSDRIVSGIIRHQQALIEIPFLTITRPCSSMFFPKMTTKTGGDYS